MGLHQIYHSTTHLFFRMEFGGPLNLFRRLTLSQKDGHSCHLLHLDKTASLISQFFGVVAFLQQGPRVCHRDLKPENITISETADELILKLCDFDLACVQDNKRQLCCSPCGTVPFIAPEVFLESQYNGFSADVWSLGVVLLEVVCCTRFLEFTLNLPKEEKGRAITREGVAWTIKMFFEAPDAVSRMLLGAVRADLRPLMPQIQEWLQGILMVNPLERVCAAHLRAYSEEVLVLAKTAVGCPTK